MVATFFFSKFNRGEKSASPPGKGEGSRRYPLNKRLGGPQCQSGWSN
jgi:hypothetical protein